MGLLLLISTISGLALHFLFFIETHSHEFTLSRLLKNIIAEITICFTNLNIFILLHSFSLNTCECL